MGINVSVIIPTYNSGKFIEKCLSSIRASAYDDYEVIVVDDCSTDDTAELAASFGVRVIKLDANRGPAYARNEGAKAALGKVIFFADSDVEFYRDTLSEVAKAFSDSVINVATGIYSNEPANKGIASLYKALFMHYHFTKRPIENYNIFASSCGLIRKSVFEKAGGFNINIKWGMDLENDEFGYRLSRFYRNPVIPRIQVKHNFPGFQKLIKTMFRRAYYWSVYFFKRKKFDAIISTPMMGVANGVAPLIVLVAILAPFNKVFFIAVFFLLLVYAAAYSGFYMYLLRERKYKEFFPILFVAFFVSVSVGAAAILAFIRRAIFSKIITEKMDEFEAVFQNT